jgi:hypothetical protein
VVRFVRIARKQHLDYAGGAETFETLIPARLDRLPWSRFHWLLVIGLGIT